MRTPRIKVVFALMAVIMVLTALPAAMAAPVATFDPSTTTFSFPMSGTYAFTGTFTHDLVINVPAGMNIILDGSGAVFQCNVEFNFPRIAGNATEMLAEPRTGSYTVQNFTVTKSLNVGSWKTELIQIKNNQMAAMELNCSNSKVVLTGNVINNQGAAKRHNSSATHTKGLFVYADNYDLVLSGNSITSATSNAIEVVGEYGWQNNDYDNSWSITNNTLTGTRAFKIYNDKTYAPVEWPEDYRITEEMEELAEQIMMRNTTQVSISVVDVLVRAADNKPDANLTEKNYLVFQEIAQKVEEMKTPASTYSAPKTGDSSNLMLWASLMIMAVCGMVVISRKRLSADR